MQKKFGKKFEDIEEDVKSILENYPWKGNVRELKNIIERICIMSDDKVLKIEHLPIDIMDPQYEMSESGVTFSLAQEVANFEKKLIEEALRKNGGNILRTSKQLNIPRGTLRHKIDKYKILAHSGEK